MIAVKVQLHRTKGGSKVRRRGVLVRLLACAQSLPLAMCADWKDILGYTFLRERETLRTFPARMN